MFIVNQTVILTLLAGGAFFDIKGRRIPNWWILSGAVLGLYLHRQEPAWFLVRMLAVTALFFPLYYCRMVGAGDIKLMALACSYCGLSGGASVIFIGFLAGAVWSLVKLIYDRSFLARFSYLTAYVRRLIRTKEVTAYYSPARDGYHMTIPFAVCLFLGGILYYANVF